MNLKKALLLLFFSIIFTIPVFGYDIPDVLRVGLEYKYKNVTSVPVSNKSILIGCGSEDFYGEAEILGTSFEFCVPDFKLVDSNEFYPSYSDALKGCDDLSKTWGYKFAPAYISANFWGVYAYKFGNDDISHAANSLNGSIVDVSKVIELKDNSTPVMFFNGVNPQIKSKDSDVITLSDRSYRGIIEFGRYTVNITAVNVISIDEYLYSALASEMPSDWESEAIKAQAVASRTYALTRRKMGIHTQNGYELCDNSNCQTYTGHSAETQQSRAAVDNTKGILIYYNDDIINSVFFSSSGGYTENSENVWSEATHYLRAVKEINENPLEWTRTFTQTELGNILSAKGKNIGTVNSIVVYKSDSGRVQELKFNGTSGKAVFSKEETRTFCSSVGSLSSRMYAINTYLPKINYNDYTNTENNNTSDNKNNSKEDTNSSIDQNNQNSQNNTEIIEMPAVTPKNYYEELGTIFMHTQNEFDEGGKVSISSNEQYNESTIYPDNGKFAFYGRGNGHGVGMSQYGAQGMAKAGYDFKKILQYYYTGTVVK